MTVPDFQSDLTIGDIYRIYGELLGLENSRSYVGRRSPEAFMIDVMDNMTRAYAGKFPEGFTAVNQSARNPVSYYSGEARLREFCTTVRGFMDNCAARGLAKKEQLFPALKSRTMGAEEMGR